MAQHAGLDDASNSYLLHHSDHPGIQLVSQALTCDYYSSWSRLMKLALSVKNKFGFVHGSIPKSLVLLTSWERNNNQIIMSWILI